MVVWTDGSVQFNPVLKIRAMTDEERKNCLALVLPELTPKFTSRRVRRVWISSSKNREENEKRKKRKNKNKMKKKKKS